MAKIYVSAYCSTSMMHFIQALRGKGFECGTHGTCHDSRVSPLTSRGEQEAEEVWERFGALGA